MSYIRGYKYSCYHCLPTIKIIVFQYCYYTKSSVPKALKYLQKSHNSYFNIPHAQWESIHDLYGLLSKPSVRKPFSVELKDR